MPEAWYPADIHTVKGKAQEAKNSDESMCPQRWQEEIGGIVDNQRNEHDEREDVELFVAALIVEEGWRKEIHTAAEKTCSHKGKHKDTARKEKGCDESQWG